MLFLTALFLVYVQAATPLKCNFVLRDPAMPSGFVNGVMKYDYDAGWMQYVYTTSGVRELFEYDPSTKAGKYTYKDSPTCSCTVLSLANSMPNLYVAGAQASAGVSNLVMANNLPSVLTMSGGRSYTFNSCVSATFSVSTDFARPANCDCGAPLDIVVVLDRSSSISTTEFGYEKQFTKDFVSGFKYSPTQVNLGISNFHINTWDGPVNLDQGNQESSVVNGAEALQCYPNAQCKVSGGGAPPSGACCGSGTCISCGVIVGADMLAKAVVAEKGTIREGAAKVLVVLTDGYHNKVTVTDAGLAKGNPKRDASGKPYGQSHSVNGVTCNEDQSQVACAADMNADLQYSVNYAQSKVPGVLIFAIGVGSTYSEAQLLLIAQGKQKQVLATRDWGQLTGLVSTLIQETCKSVPGTSCSASCCGFCSCGGNCVAPDGCDNSNICTTTTVNGVCCKSTLLPPPGPAECKGTDMCYTYGCDATLNNGKGKCTSTLNPVQESTPCASYKCDPATGKTVYTDLCPCAIPCKLDSDCGSFKTSCNTVKCIVDPADPCKNYCKATDTTASCDKGDLCMNYGCDPATGCTATPKPVPAETTCQTFSCVKGVMVPTAKPSCIKCTAADLSKCSDNNMCTTESCVVDANDPLKNYCDHTDITPSCNKGDLCMNYACDPATGCTATAKPVPAETMCQTFACVKGVMVPSPKDVCIDCTASDFSKCDDKNVCTVEGCAVDPSGDPLKNTCTHMDTSASCDKGNLCMNYKCDPVAGCQETAKPIPAETTCLTYSCDPATGKISSTPKAGCIACTAADISKCDDNNVCTDESCIVDPSGDPLLNRCSNTDTSAKCVGTDLCKNYFCDPVAGCQETAKAIPAETRCLTYTCDSATGNFPSTPKDACIECTASDSAKCDDKDACTLEGCSVDPANPLNNKCTHTDTSANCKGNDLCKNYGCNPVGGCFETPIPVPPEAECLTFACVAGNIVSTPKDVCIICTDVDSSKCDDKNVCTSESCTVDPTNPLQNTCKFTTLPCPPTPQTDFCFVWSCDPVTGCASTPVEIPKSDECFKYTCDTATGDVVTENLHCSPPACKIDADCDDKNACTVDTCYWPDKTDNKTAVCQQTPLVVEVDCNDNNACTIDTCVPETGCTHTNNSASCDDGNACTIDTCDPANFTQPCQYADVVCQEKDVCHRPRCDIIDGCQQVPFVCPNSDNCTFAGCYTRKEADEKNKEKGVKYGAPGSRLSGCYVEEAGNCTFVPAAGLVAGLAAGAVAGIVVAAVAAAAMFGGASAYAFTASAGSSVTATVANNPIYKPGGEAGYSPLYKV